MSLLALGPALWAGLIVAGHLLGARLYDADPLVRIGAPPLVGTADVDINTALAGAVVLGLAAIAWAPVLAARLTWRWLLFGTWAAGAGWAVSLAAADGWDALAEPLTTRYEYLAAVDRVGGAHSFLSGFIDALATYPTHVKGHPPGLLLLLWGLDRIGLGGADVAALLVIGVGSLTGVAVLVAVRALVDEVTARAAAPFLAFAPAAVWVATSADALFAGVSAVGIACFAVAATSVGRRATVAGVVSGLVLGLALHLSYGVGPLGLMVVAIALHRRAWRALAAACIGLVLVTGAFVVGGFWWPDGLDATRTLYYEGVASRRPYLDFLVMSPAAFALATGPAAAAGIATLRDRRVWVLVGSALAAVAVAEFSGLSRGETERIWLPFVGWLLVTAAFLRPVRPWLAAQVALAIALQAGVRSPW